MQNGFMKNLLIIPTFFISIILIYSCSSDIKIGKRNYYGENYKIISGNFSGINYVMLVGKGENKYPLTIDFKKDRKTFFIKKNTKSVNKNITWHSVTDTTNNIYQCFGIKLEGGAGLQENIFSPINEEDKKAFYNISDILNERNSFLKLAKDSINRIIGWVKVNDRN